VPTMKKLGVAAMAVTPFYIPIPSIVVSYFISNP
jgi:hypothetical protein